MALFAKIILTVAFAPVAAYVGSHVFALPFFLTHLIFHKPRNQDSAIRCGVVAFGAIYLVQAFTIKNVDWAVFSVLVAVSCGIGIHLSYSKTEN